MHVELIQAGVGRYSHARVDIMDSADNNQVRRLIALVSFAAALALYLFTTTRYAVPDESTSYLVQHLGLTPFLPMSHVVWGWLARALASLGLHPLALLPNILSAACGAGVVALVFLLASRLAYNLEFEVEIERIRLLAGAAAAAYAATAAPLWIVGTRAHPLAFDTLLLLSALLFLLRYKDAGRTADLYTCAVVGAVALAECPTSFLFVVPFGFYVLWQMRRRGHLQAGPLIRVACCGLLAPLIYLVAAWHYARSPAASWREFESFWQILKFFPRQQWLELSQSVPRQGWLIMLLVTFLPWVACLYVNRRGGYAEGGLGSWFLHGLMFALGLVVLFRGPVPVASLAQDLPLLVTPVLMSATFFGYAVGYGSALLAPRAGRVGLARPGTMLAPALLAIVVAVAAGFANFPRVSTTSARAVHVIARAMVDGMAGRSVLVSGGLLDLSLLVEARDAGRPLTIIQLESAQNVAYARYVASLMDTPRLQGVAQVGLLPMLLEWMETAPDVADRLAVEGTPDYWLSTGFQVLPRGGLYLAARRLAAFDPGRFFTECRDFWARVTPALDELAAGPDPMPIYAASLRRHFSRVANDAGILMENLGQNVEAAQGYEEALHLDARNLVAQANLQDLCARAGDTNRAALLAARIAGEMADAAGHPPLRSLTDQFGHVRTAESYARLQGTNAASSAPAAALPQELVNAMALYRQHKLAEARSILEALTQNRPDVDEAWVLLAGVADEQDDVATVQTCMVRMREQKKQWPPLLIIMARRSIAREDYQSARDYLEETAKLWPSHLGTLEQLVRLYLREGSKRYMGWAVQNVLSLDPESPVGNYAAGRMLEEKKQPALAEDAYRRVKPSTMYAQAQARIARLLIARGVSDEAERTARRVVEMDAGLAEGWEALGGVMLDQKKYPDAMSAFRRALDIDPKALDAQIGLAEIDLAAGRADQARAAAKKLLVDRDAMTPDQLAALELIEK